MKKQDLPEESTLYPKSCLAKDTIKARKDSPLTQFSDKIGKTVVVEKDTKSSRLSSLHGFHCSTCKASFTSSDAYLDHCNGQVHQRNLGLTLKVERINQVDRVRARLQLLTKKRQITEQVIESKSTDHFEKQLDDAQAKNDRVKEDRKNRKKQKKLNKNFAEVEQSHEDLIISDEPEDFMSSMGFKAFS